MLANAFQRVQSKKNAIRTFVASHSSQLFSQLAATWRNNDWDKWVKWEADPWDNVVAPPWKNETNTEAD